jgi:hypothetical protein
MSTRTCAGGRDSYCDPASAFTSGRSRVGVAAPAHVSRGDRVSCAARAISCVLRLVVAALGDLTACRFSTSAWEPPFHRGLVRPTLRLVLRRSIAYQLGLRPRWSWPTSFRILACEPFTPSRSRATANRRTSLTRSAMPFSSRALPCSFAPVCRPPRPSTCATRSPQSLAPASLGRGSAWSPTPVVARSGPRAAPCSTA